MQEQDKPVWTYKIIGQLQGVDRCTVYLPQGRELPELFYEKTAKEICDNFNRIESLESIQKEHEGYVSALVEMNVKLGEALREFVNLQEGNISALKSTPMERLRNAQSLLSPSTDNEK